MATDNSMNSSMIPKVRKRTRLVRPYPVHVLEEALAVASAIQESNAGRPFDRILLAKALGTTPASSGFTMRLNSSSRYGLTEGGYSDARISLTARGEAIVASKDPQVRPQALVEAALEPDLFHRFYDTFDGKRIPDEPYVGNTLREELGVHADLSSECLRIVVANGVYVGIVTEVGGSLYVSIQGAPDRTSTTPEPRPQSGTTPATRIFVGHTGNVAALDFLKNLLGGFGIPCGYVEADEVAAASVSPQVSAEMRNCSAAVLVFGMPDGESMSEINGAAAEEMAYQLGAATILYGERIVILRQKGLDMPQQASGVPSVEFEPGRLQDVAFPLLRELYQAGIVNVRA